MRATLAMSAAGALLLGAGAAHAAPVAYQANLDVAQEAPAPSATTGGNGVFSATLRGRTLRWRLTTRRLTGAAQQAHVHVGAPGVAGPVALTLCGPCRRAVRGSARIDRALARALRAGRAYVNVHTDQNPAGEIRGQVATRYRLTARLNRGQEVPRPRGVRAGAGGTFRGTLLVIGRSATLDYVLRTRRLSGRPVAAHLHRGRRRVAGPVLVDLCGPCRSVQRGSQPVDAATLARLRRAAVYVNVHTARNPAGEVRGQLLVRSR